MHNYTHPPAITLDNKISFAELARREGVSPAAVHRWHRKATPPLPAVRVGRRFFTSVDAVNWWMAERQRRDTAQHIGHGEADAGEDLDAIEAECEAAGI